jgi:hypothetical protein
MWKNAMDAEADKTCEEDHKSATGEDSVVLWDLSKGI